jgi:alpha-ribazole phosphatase/probable phosphoglycerate mutase
MPKYEKNRPSSDIEPKDESHRIFFVRHGETDWNREFKYQGITDIELNGTGLEQARRIGVRLAQTAPSRVIASPLLRARRTAELIMELNSADVTIEPCDDIKEISFGAWEGLTVSEVKERHSETFAAWRKAPFSVTPAGGESFGEVVSRAGRASKMIEAAGRPGDVTFVVGHGAILRGLIAALMNIADMNVMWRMRLDNCSVTVLDLWGQYPSLLLVNDTHHLRLADADIEKLIFPS